ncbi:hypothetical protein [Duganella sp. Root336D2]|uniref:hypothetical protein n=1 Tax=Duganella sp. Root336D2 TaxID=1736518 RepID=UPI0006F7275E|nr:hypothetical protein [Duganella sp. Root336D2]KQV54043.1 hypothetical protein ASD07_05740 [Duganella sp. Root336D2]
MIAQALRVIALNEVRLRLRRLSTLAALLAAMALCWLAIADPADGVTMMVIDGRRVLYTSQALAFGSAHIAGMLLGLAGFYLVRGRVADDLQSGMGAVIAATGASNALLAVGRWLGGMAYLMLFVLAYLGSTLALHALRGEGPIQLLVYLQTYVLMLLPIISYAAACAVLFDNVGALVGKRGDVLFFFLWCLQFGALIGVTESPGALWPMFIDFSGLSVAVTTLREHFETTNFVLGRTAFDPAGAVLVIPDSLWTLKAWGFRVATLLLSLLLLTPATLFFHRYSPDRVRPRSTRGNRLLALVDRALRPVAWAVRPLPGLAMRVPGFAGEVLAEVALVLSMSPSAALALAAGTVAASVVAPGALTGVMMGGVACWGVIVCGIVPRDWQNGADAMTGALPGGVVRRFLRQWAASLVLALPLAIIALRWSLDAPVRASAAIAGVLALASAASLLGGLTRGARLFLALFLFTWYIALNSPKEAALDLVGFNGSASAGTAVAWALAGCLAWAAAFAHSRWRQA